MGAAMMNSAMIVCQKFRLLKQCFVVTQKDSDCAERRRCEGVSNGSYSRLYTYTSCD